MDVSQERTEVYSEVEVVLAVGDSDGGERARSMDVRIGERNENATMMVMVVVVLLYGYDI